MSLVDARTVAFMMFCVYRQNLITDSKGTEPSACLTELCTYMYYRELDIVRSLAFLRTRVLEKEELYEALCLQWTQKTVYDRAMSIL